MSPLDEATNKWMEQYNDYSCLTDYDKAGTLSHYLNVDKLKKVLESGYFWAEEILRFPDPNEGRAALHYLKEDLRSLFPNKSEQEAISKAIPKALDKERIDFISFTYVTCFCMEENSDYMFDKFRVKDERTQGRDCEIVFDGAKLYESMYFNYHKSEDLIIKKSGEHFIKNRLIVYSGNEWKKIVEDEVKKLWPLLTATNTHHTLDDAAERLVRKIYFLGTYFKVPSEENAVSEEEKEVRILADINSLFIKHGDMSKKDNYVWEHEEGKYNDRRMIYLYYSLDSIKHIRVKKEKVDEAKNSIAALMKLGEEKKQQLLGLICTR